MENEDFKNLPSNASITPVMKRTPLKSHIKFKQNNGNAKINLVNMPSSSKYPQNKGFRSPQPQQIIGGTMRSSNTQTNSKKNSSRNGTNSTTPVSIPSSFKASRTIKNDQNNYLTKMSKIRNTDLNVNFSGGSQNQKGFNNYEETKMSGDINNNQFHDKHDIQIDSSVTESEISELPNVKQQYAAQRKIKNKHHTKINSPQSHHFDFNEKERKESLVNKRIRGFKSPPITTANIFGTIVKNLTQKSKITPNPNRRMLSLKRTNNKIATNAYMTSLVFRNIHQKLK